MKIGNAIKAYRFKNDISLRELAKTTGIGHTTLMRIENGKEVRTECWIRLLIWLLSDDENNNKGSK